MHDNIDVCERANEKIRIKVTDRCNMRCWFCHAEGAPNSKDLIVDDKLAHVLKNVKDVFSKAHITGGEPFMYGLLDKLLDMLEENGYRILLTSNGNFALNQKNIDIVKRLEAINISFHSLEPEYYSFLTRSNKGKSIIEKIKDNIIWLSNVVSVRINTVVSGNGQTQSLDDIICFAAETGCELKLVPELRTKAVSLQAIEELLSRNGFTLFQKVHILPGSNVRERYQNQTGSIIEIKKLAPCFPNCLCANCSELERCDEGFSFFRLGGNPLYCQACIKHPPIPFEEYLSLYWDDLKREYSVTK